MFHELDLNTNYKKLLIKQLKKMFQVISKVTCQLRGPCSLQCFRRWLGWGGGVGGERIGSLSLAM